MATPMTPDRMIAQLRKWHVPFREVSGWRTHNRNHVGAWGPVSGLVVHHTGDDAADSIDLQVIRAGRSDLPGPLAQFGCDDDGVIWLVGWGRANHAGGGDPRVLEAIRRASYAAYPPAPHEHQGSPGSVDGNARFYGVETFYSGRRKPTDAAMRSLILLAAAICDAHGWNSKRVIGHKEWSDWKSDPGNVDMAAFRRQVARALAGREIEIRKVYMTRTRRRLLIARDALSAARNSLDRAIRHGAPRQPMRDRITTTIERLNREISRIRKD